MKVKDIIFCLIYLVLTLSGMTLIKMGNQQGGNILFQFGGIFITAKLILGIICYGFSFLFFTFIISKMQISLIIPLVAAINSVCIVIIGMSFLRNAL